MKIKFEQEYQTDQNIYILKYENFQMEVSYSLMFKNKQKSVQVIRLNSFKIVNETSSKLYKRNVISIEIFNNMYNIIQTETLEELKINNSVLNSSKEDLKKNLKLIIEKIFTHNYYKYHEK